MRSFFSELVDLVLPACCARCSGPVFEREALCDACWRALHPIARAVCCRCQAIATACGERCASCSIRPDALDACLAEVWFEGQTPPWIRRVKYPSRGPGGLDPAARAVFALLAERAAARVPGPAPDCVVPVPLHRRALTRRGFNPAALLARHIARRRRIAWDPVALVRLRDTPSQTGLSRARRRRNVDGVFQARRGGVAARVWLVDDVVTTGATLVSAARAARAGGAREIVAICAARTPAPRRLL